MVWRSESDLRRVEGRQRLTSSLWQLVLVVIAIRTRNTVQVVAVTAFNFAFLGYAVIQVSSSMDKASFLSSYTDI